MVVEIEMERERERKKALGFGGRDSVTVEERERGLIWGNSVKVGFDCWPELG